MIYRQSEKYIGEVGTSLRTTVYESLVCLLLLLAETRLEIEKIWQYPIIVCPSLRVCVNMRMTCILQ